jgi:hypothetical protein
MAGEENNTNKKGEGAATVYVETVNGYIGPAVTLKAPDVGAYTTAQSDAKFGVPIASATVLGKIRVGAGLTIDANGVLGTTAAAPDWSAIINKPTEFPPSKAGINVVGGVKVGTGLSIAADGTLSSNASAPDWANITGKPAAYPPTKASSTQIGGVKQGSGIFIDPDTGTINATGSKPTWADIENKPTTFDPPIASNSVLGGVKEGVGVNIGSDGTISATPTWDEIVQKPNEFPPVPATKTVRGGIFVGDGLKDDGNGVVSLELARPNDIGGVILGKTLATDAISGRTDVVPASKDNFGAVKIGDTLFIDDAGDLQANPGAISPATATTLGGVKIGDGVDVTEEGVISVPQGYPFPRNMKIGTNGEGIWYVPEGCDVFSVTLVGAGGSGGSGWEGSEKPGKTGGAGGGGGGWIKVTLKDVPKGTAFRFKAPQSNNNEAAFTHIDGDKSTVIAKATSGTDGAKCSLTDASAVPMGGRGGAPILGTSPWIVGSISGRGGEGGCGFGINSKQIAGLGGGSMFGGAGWYSYTAGAGGGGGGVNIDPNNLNAAAGQPGLVIIEW